MGSIVNTINRLLPSRWRLVKLRSNAIKTFDSRGDGIEPLRQLSSAEDRIRYHYLGPDLALMRLRDGHFLYVDPQDVYVSHNLIAHGFWEPQVHAAVCSLVSPGQTVVEVGANVGFYTMAMAREVGSGGMIVTVEANTRLANMVQQSSLLNGYSDRVRVVARAASDQTGNITFMMSRRFAGSGHTQVEASPSGPEWEKVEVEAIRLDDLDVKDVDFLRIDAEGSEPLILRGAERLLSSPTIIVCLEWAVIQMASRASVPDLVQWLVNMGFSFWRIMDDASLSPVVPEALLNIDFCEIVMSRRSPPGAISDTISADGQVK